HFSEDFRGDAGEQWQDAFRPTDGFSAVEHVHLRRSEVPEKPSFYLRFVGGAHKPHNDALYPRCTKRSRARAIQNFTNACADRVEIWFRVIRCHLRFSFSFCCLKTGWFL